MLVSADDRFIALERASGERRWEAPVGEHAGGAVLTRAGSDPIALVTTESGLVVGLDDRTGQARWSAQVPGDIWAAPAATAAAAVGAVLWAGAEGETVNRLRVFDLATGAVRWEWGVEAGATAPVIHDGLVVLGEGNGNFAARIVARDLATGAERWSVPAPASFESGVTPGAAGGDVVVSDHFGTVTLWDASFPGFPGKGRQYEGKVFAIDFGPGGRLMVSKRPLKAVALTRSKLALPTGT